MRCRFLFLTSALCMCAVPALCSDCIDGECDASDVKYEFVETYFDTMTGPEYIADEVITVEYDGVKDDKYKPTKHARTVSWKNGIPIWDDSISNYRAKDFGDWGPEFYMYDGNDEIVTLYNGTVIDADDARAQIEELLAPNRPNENMWQETTIDVTFNNDGCPFETDAECDIWRAKPTVRENVSPRSPKIRDDKMIEFLAGMDCSGEIDANSDAAAPLVARYKMLMNSARACCTEGMTYALRRAGASDGLIYKFMSDDANFYHIGNRCLMTTDSEIDAQYGNSATASVISDVRNGCLCRGREWFTAMLAPFVEAWKINPDFAASPFIWTYRDGLKRNITVSINNDVQNVLNQLAQCP